MAKGRDFKANPQTLQGKILKCFRKVRTHPPTSYIAIYEEMQFNKSIRPTPTVCLIHALTLWGLCPQKARVEEYRSEQSSPEEKLFIISYNIFRFPKEMFTSHRQESRMVVIDPMMNNIRFGYCEKGNRPGIRRPTFYSWLS